MTLLAAEALRDLPEPTELIAVTGPAFSRRAGLEALQRSLQRKLTVIHEAGGHIAELMQDADVVCCSGGMSVYEIAALGTPGIVLAQNAKEDERMRAFARNGTIEYLGLGTDVSPTRLREAVGALLGDLGRRQTMSARGQALVDGLGAQRAAEIVLEKDRQREVELLVEGPKG